MITNYLFDVGSVPYEDISTKLDFYFKVRGFVKDSISNCNTAVYSEKDKGEEWFSRKIMVSPVNFPKSLVLSVTEDSPDSSKKFSFRDFKNFLNGKK